jgi:dipeptidyl aminopeptidase/acylaminoacyl peptidase
MTQAAVLVALDFLRQQPFVHPHKVALYGYSRGAIVASMVATLEPTVAAVELGAGAYNFFNWYPTPLRGIDANIGREAGTSADAFRARSAIYHVDKMKTPILLLHSAQDERIPVRQAEAFAEKLQATGLTVTLKIFPIPVIAFWSMTNTARSIPSLRRLSASRHARSGGGGWALSPDRRLGRPVLFTGTAA